MSTVDAVTTIIICIATANQHCNDKQEVMTGGAQSADVRKRLTAIGQGWWQKWELLLPVENRHGCKHDITGCTKQHRFIEGFKSSLSPWNWYFAIETRFLLSVIYIVRRIA